MVAGGSQFATYGFNTFPTDRIDGKIRPVAMCGIICCMGVSRVGDTGFELTSISSGNDALAVECNVKCNALADDSIAIDPDLEGLIRAWPNLSESVRKEIIKHLPSPSTR